MFDTPTAAPLAGPPWLLQLRRVVRWTLALLAVAWCVLIVAWLILHWAILPHIEQWRPQVERRASAALGVAVRIGAIDVQSRGWVPALELKQVVLADPDGREALRLPRVAAALSPRSLLALEPRFEQLLIDGPQLEIRRDALGRLHVAGIPIGGASNDDDSHAAADWFFAQHEFVIRGGQVRWVDERRVAPPLELSDVTLVVRNGLRQHAIRLEATPPPGWGERVTLTGRFRHSLLARAGDWRRWSGTLHAELPRADVRELRRHVDLPFDLTEGRGALRAWLDIERGQADAATVDLALVDVALRLAPTVEPLAFSRIEGRLSATRRDDRITVNAERFGFDTAGGVQWPSGNLNLVLGQRDGATTSGEFSADRLDLALMAGIASKLPLGDALHHLLAELEPRGIVSGLTARWDGPLDAPQHYQAKARISGLAIASRPAQQPHGVGRPGLVNTDVDLQANESGGEAKLTIADGALQFPGVFERPEVALQQFSAQLGWRIDAASKPDVPSRVELQVKNARFANADAAGELNGTWSTGPGAGLARGGRFPGQLDLSAKLDRARAAATARYLPLGIPQPARRYVERAVKAGSLGNATFKVKGDLWDFPFYNAKQGEFRITAKLNDVTFDYVPSVPTGSDEPAWASPWPGLTNVNGELVFDRTSMKVRDAQGRLGGFELSKVSATIADLVNGPVLAVDGNGRGPLADALRFINRSPVGKWTGDALAQATATGAADLKLALRIPLDDVDRSTVHGSVALADNDVRIKPDTPMLGGARGRVEFSHRGFAIANGAARVLGGDATFDGGTQADGSLRFSGQGVATAEGLRRAAEMPLLARTAVSLSGQTPYRVTLGIVGGGTEISVTSNLVGIGSGLPSPLGKSAEVALPMQYQTTLAGADSMRDTLRFELGTVVQAQFVRDLSGDVPRVLRGGVGIGDTMPQPASGVHANVNVPNINADAWETTAGALFGGVAGDMGDSSGGYAPTHVALRANEIVAEGRRLTKLVAGLTAADGGWRANLDADQMHGYADWRPARAGAAAGRLYARLTRLALPEQAEAQSFESLLDAEPGSVPALDVVIDDFELRGKKLGKVEIEAVNRSDGQREWQLSKLALTTPEAQFVASGQWISPNAAAKRRRSVLNFKLDLADSGALLERLGFGRMVRAGKGRMQGQVHWDGSPLAFDAGSLSGDVNVALDAGQFLKADPGAARLLGVLSLQALPRRLALDFRDVFQQGFAFDNITGDVRITDGVATTNNLRMRGVQAAVLMEGQADLERETQDLRVLVVPEINAATASLAYAVINPAIGLGTFLAQLALRRPLMQATTREFHVSGPWADPKVERVERRLTAPLPNDDAAAAAVPPLRTP